MQISKFTILIGFFISYLAIVTCCAELILADQKIHNSCMPSFKLQPIFHNHEEYMITLLRKHTIKKVGAASIREKTM